jgi:hypothetical protein
MLLPNKGARKVVDFIPVKNVHKGDIRVRYAVDPLEYYPRREAGGGEGPRDNRRLPLTPRRSTKTVRIRPRIRTTRMVLPHRLSHKRQSYRLRMLESSGKRRRKTIR